MQTQLVDIPDDLYADMSKYLPSKWTTSLTPNSSGDNHQIDVSVIIENGGTEAILTDTSMLHVTNHHYLLWLLDFTVAATALLMYFTIFPTFVTFLVAAVICGLLEMYNLTARELQLERCKYANSVIQRMSFVIMRQCDSELIVAEQARSNEYKGIVDKLLLDINAINAEHLQLYEFISKENKSLALRFINTVRNPQATEPVSLVVHSTKIH